MLIERSPLATRQAEPAAALSSLASAPHPDDIALLLHAIQRPAVRTAIMQLLQTLVENDPPAQAPQPRRPLGMAEAQQPLAPPPAPPMPAPVVTRPLAPAARPAAATPTGEDMAQQLHAALLARKSGLQLYYQPVVDARSGALTGFEALLRWTTNDGREIPPLEVLAIAAGANLSETLDFWVLQEAVTRARGWVQQQPNLVVAVNVTEALLISPLAVSAVRSLLRGNNLAAGNLCIEVTETVLLDERATQNLAALRKLGLKLAIDDFGTGQSALTRLMELDVDVVKLDRAFFTGRSLGQQQLSFLTAMVKMAHARGSAVVAEGVATREDAWLAGQIGCENCQGFWFAGALTGNAAASLVGSTPAELPWAGAGTPARR